MYINDWGELLCACFLAFMVTSIFMAVMLLSTADGYRSDRRDMQRYVDKVMDETCKFKGYDYAITGQEAFFCVSDVLPTVVLLEKR